MTLTHMMPSLRRSIPDPISTDLWPEHTTATTTDVSVAGVSMLRLAEICQTPCIHTAAAVIPGTHGRPSVTDRASAIVTAVTAISLSPTGTLWVRVDARLDDVRPILSEARLIGRASVAHGISAALVLRELADEEPGVVEILASGLPADLVPGDLLVVPCRGDLALRNVRPRASYLERRAMVSR
ncbi:hypothetical protein KPL76_03360 [Subtercola sp. PAMC28395]|uniref:hypothetical protein n=1 Tax=Subtercola sp. PAMC28395 TaxID=2846775 RepID=UPI001C0CFD09|nr:hypothetical protein [Subtercola sp. PAMC28395]QWT24451.1 hypothetical protein KPL76_03360 [Subtercola sp. PAMC28395]